MEQIWLQGKERAKKTANRQEEWARKRDRTPQGRLLCLNRMENGIESRREEEWKSGRLIFDPDNELLMKPWWKSQSVCRAMWSWKRDQTETRSYSKSDAKNWVSGAATQQSEQEAPVSISGLNHYKPPETEQERAEEISAPRQPPQRPCSFQHQLRIHGTR